MHDKVVNNRLPNRGILSSFSPCLFPVTGMAGGDEAAVGPDCVSLTSDSEEDEVHLHHMHDTRSSADADYQNSAQSQAPHQKVGMTDVTQVATTRIRSLRQPQTDARSHDAKHNSMSFPAPPATPPPVVPPATVFQNPVIATSCKGLASAGPKNLEPSHFSFEPEDLLSKSLTRLDPRLLSRSGVYRQKSILDPN